MTRLTQHDGQCILRVELSFKSQDERSHSKHYQTLAQNIMNSGYFQKTLFNSLLKKSSNTCS
jgi:hypothetical protein